MQQNRKQAEELYRWIKWRECYPVAAWAGTRGDDAVTARVPRERPEVHERGGVAPPAAAVDYAEAAGAADDQDIPFLPIDERTT